MTDTRIILPVLQNGVSTIGDLWDERSLRAPGVNLFKNTFSSLVKHEKLNISNSVSEGETVQLEMKSKSDMLKSVDVAASVSVSIFAGLVKVEGGISFGFGESQSTNEEELHWAWLQDQAEAALNEFEPGSDLLDPHVCKLLQEGKLHATHVVKAVTLGGEASGTMKVRQNNTSNNYKLGASLSGQMMYGPIGVALDASMEVGESVSVKNYSKVITLQSVPPVEAPVEVTDFENLDTRIQEMMTYEKHYPGAELDLIGIPKRFELVPISSYIPSFPPTPALELLDATVLDDLLKALQSIHDHTNTEFIKKELLKKQPRILKLIQDPQHYITKSVTEKENEYSKKALEYKKRLVDAFTSSDDDERSKLKGILNEFVEWLSTTENGTVSFVEKTQTEAEKELSAVRVRVDLARGQEDSIEDSSEFDKMDEKVPLQFFTNKDELNRWLSSERMIKVLYMTREAQEPNGIPSRLYRMSLALGKINVAVGVSYPSVKDVEYICTTTKSIDDDKESLRVFAHRQDYGSGWTDTQEMKFLTNVLEAAAGVAKSGASRLYDVYAELMGIPLPMWPNADHVVSLYEVLSNQLQDIVICESTFETLGAIGTEPSNWKILFTLDGLHSITDVVNGISYVQEMRRVESSIHVDLILGTFSQTYEEAPILFLFKDKELKAACLDHLDLLILINELRTTQKFECLLPSNKDDNCFSPNRLEYAIVVKNIPLSLQASPETRPKMPLPENPLSQALEISTAMLKNPMDSAINVCSALARIVISMDPEFLNQIKQDFWNQAENRLDLSLNEYDEWMKLLDTIDKYINETIDDKRLILLENTILALNQIIFELELDGPTSKIDPTFKIDAQIANVLDEWPDSNQILDALCELKELHTYPATKAKLALLNVKMLRETVVSNNQIHLQNLRSIVAQIVNSQDVPQHTMDRLLISYVGRIIFPTEDPTQRHLSNLEPKVFDTLRQRNYYGLVRLFVLCNLKFEDYIIIQAFQRFESVWDERALITFFNDLGKHEFTEETLRRIWENTKFQYLMLQKQNANNLLILFAIKELHCKDGKIPSYILPEIANNLLPLLANNSKLFNWPEKWSSFKLALRAFQIFVTRGVIPDSFPRVLLENMLHSQDFSESLTQSNAPIFWNDKHKCFMEPWDQHTLQIILNHALLHPRVANVIHFRGECKDDTQAEKNWLRTTRSWGLFEPAAYFSVKDLKSNSDQHKIMLQILEKLKRGYTLSDIFSRIIPNSNESLARVDAITSIFNGIVDQALLRRILQKLIRPNVAIPLVIRDPGSSEYKYLIKSVIGREVDVPGIPRGNLLFRPPYRFVTALRVGSNKIGKSSILNQMLMKNNTCFVSCNPASTQPVPRALQGFTEITILTKKSCDERIWDTVPTDKILLLGNVHGNALELPPDLLLHLSQLSTSFLVFWMPQSFNEMTVNKRRLCTALQIQPEVVFDIFVEPKDPEVISNVVPELILTTPLDSANNSKKLCNVLQLALQRDTPLTNQLTSKAVFGNTSLEAEHFLSFVKQKSVQYVRKLLVLQRTETNTVEQIEKLWSTNLDYAKLMGLFCKALVVSNRTETLNSISEALEYFTQSSTQIYQVQMKQLLQELENLTSESQVYRTTKMQIQLIRREIQTRSISLKHFIIEVGRIHNWLPGMLGHVNFPKLISDLLHESNEVPVPTSTNNFFTETWFTEALNLFSDRYKQFRVFTLSVISTPSESQLKTDLLEAIFGLPLISTQEQVLKEGMTIRLLFLEPILCEKTGLDAILVINSESVCQEHERGDKAEEEIDANILATLLATSDLTIIATSNAIKPNFNNTIKNALLKLIRLMNNFQAFYPDILFANFVDADEMGSIVTDSIKNILDHLTTNFENNAFELGQIQPLNRLFSKLRKRIDLGFITQNVRNLDGYLDPSGAQCVLSEIINQMSNSGRHTTISNWIHWMNQVWHELVRAGIYPPSPFTEISEMLDLTRGMAEVKTFIYKAVHLHSEENDYFMETKMTNAHENNDVESQKNEIFNQILAKTTQIYTNNCKMNNGGPCEFCPLALEVRDRLSQTFPMHRELIEKELNHCASISKDSIARKVEQMLFVLELAPPGGSTIVSPTSNKDSLTQFQRLSMKIQVVPGERNQEARDVYRDVPFNMEMYNNSSLDDRLFEKLEAFEDNPALSTNKLHWTKAVSLRNAIEVLPGDIFVDRGARTYEWGMSRDLKDRLVMLLETLEGELGRKFLNTFRYHVHAFALARFKIFISSVEKEWNNMYSPMKFASIPHVIEGGWKAE